MRAQAAYNKSAKGRATQRRYKKSAKGRATFQFLNYHNALEKAVRRRYAFSEKGRQNDKVRKRRYLYGITPEQYSQLEALQKGRCAICDKEAKLCVDHNHITGKVRALLCVKCNSALGLLEENPRIVEQLMVYLQRHERE